MAFKIGFVIYDARTVKRWYSMQKKHIVVLIVGLLSVGVLGVSMGLMYNYGENNAFLVVLMLSGTVCATCLVYGAYLRVKNLEYRAKINLDKTIEPNEKKKCANDLIAEHYLKIALERGGLRAFFSGTVWYEKMFIDRFGNFYFRGDDILHATYSFYKQNLLPKQLIYNTLKDICETEKCYSVIENVLEMLSYQYHAENEKKAAFSLDIKSLLDALDNRENLTQEEQHINENIKNDATYKYLRSEMEEKPLRFEISSNLTQAEFKEIIKKANLDNYVSIRVDEDENFCEASGNWGGIYAEKFENEYKVTEIKECGRIVNKYKCTTIEGVYKATIEFLRNEFSWTM